MSVRSGALPEITRPGVGVVMVSRWRLGSPERQRAAVEAIGRAWGSREWPDTGLLSYSVLTGNDGDTLLHYSQWSGADAYAEFVRTRRDERNAEIDAAVPGIERVGLRPYELYRADRAEDESRVPGCVVIVEVEFEGPDAGRQKGWVDAVFAALASDPAPAPGGISAHFHVSTDGTRVLNFAQWETQQAHIDALAAPGDGIGSATDEWRRVQNYPGLAVSSVTRYTPALSLSAG
ncbi:antibiotic biosynthesis monooxygenase [Streptomyces odonnellii]|uniref:antibiotic biosynthesis monooxygenase n=1 Tax=Streptomyces odonnellii TaxID=1417980 RepID=UPI0006262A6A|nr:antibiotic biosynthesis monooxygenase [Streptomyces odonnellii]